MSSSIERSSFTQRVSRHGQADLDTNEVFLAALRVQLLGTQMAQLQGIGVGALGGLPQSRDSAAADPSSMVHTQAKTAALFLDELPPFLALGVTESRLLVYPRHSLFYWLKPCIGAVPLCDVSVSRRPKFPKKKTLFGQEKYRMDLNLAGTELPLEVTRKAALFLAVLTPLLKRSTSA